MSVTVTKDFTKQLRAAMNAMASSQAMVGVPAATAGREIDPQDPGPINNATIGYIMQNGSPAANIPARPHLDEGIADVKDEIVARYKNGAEAVLSGRLKDPSKVHLAAGLIAEKGIKARITDGPFVPLAPSTIAKRKARGRQSEKPLIDTAQYRNSITHVVRPKG